MQARTLLEFLKIEHTLFALPFVLAGLALGLVERPLAWPDAMRVGALVLVAATAARTAGMTLNRIIDRAIDAANPRTATRALPAGTMSMRTALLLAALATGALVVGAWALNPLVLALSPVLVALFVAYPYAKRFTWACHFVLGLVFLCAPAGGYLAVTGSFAGWVPPFLLGLAAMAWVAGFDVIYALLDVGFDRSHRVHSLPADLGEATARRVAVVLHALVVVLLAAFAWTTGLAWPMYVAIVVVAGLLAYEHVTVDARDAAAINKAFFPVNAVIGWVVLAGLVGALFLR